MDAPAKQPDPPIRVILVDDSAVVRGLMARALQQDESIHIVATANDGEMALQVVRNNPADVIVLDIEMPRKNGLEALPDLLRLAPNAQVIMASSLTLRNAEISMKALEMGAADYIPKPSSRGDQSAIIAFYEELRQKVCALGRVSQQRAASSAATKAAVPADKPAVSAHHYKAPRHTIRAIAVASSTGGPQALAALLAASRESLRHTSVFITQHMPATFTGLLANHLAADSGLPCAEARDGETVKAGRVYVAPGDFHMQCEQVGADVLIRLNQQPPINYCRPAADPMFISLASIYGNHLLGIVLTGMGSDGLAGARNIMEHGGTIIVQDKASSVVWGMPGAIANANACHAIVPLNEMSNYIAQAVRI